MQIIIIIDAYNRPEYSVNHERAARLMLDLDVPWLIWFGESTLEKRDFYEHKSIPKESNLKSY